MRVEDALQLVCRLFQVFLPLGFEELLELSRDLAVMGFFESARDADAPVEVRVVDTACNGYLDWLRLVHFV